MTSPELRQVAEEWETALSLAEEALAASGKTFSPDETHARLLALAQERRETTRSLAALARLLHLRLR